MKRVLKISKDEPWNEGLNVERRLVGLALACSGWLVDRDEGNGSE